MAAESIKEKSSYISQRGEKSANLESILRNCFRKVMANPFQPEDNPDGIINLGTSENKLVMDMLSERFSKINLGNMPKHYMQYADMQGIPEFKKSLAAFLNKFMKPAEPIEKDNIYVFNGCGSVLELMAFAVCDPGDAVLMPSPFYGAFKIYVACRMGCVVLPTELTSEVKAEYGETKPFELSVGRMEEAYTKAVSQGLKVKAILLSNPNNPLGYIYSKKQLIEYLQFASKYKLHLIIDEIYFLSIHGEDVAMTNALSLSGVIDPELLHIVWGFSKDFAVSGFRCGLVHTVNKQVSSVLLANAYFQSVPTPTQYILKSIIDDHDWLENVYIKENQKRLRNAHDYICKELKEIGVDVFPSVAGLYIWVDFRKYVHPLSREGELKLLHMFLDNGVYISPNVAFHGVDHVYFRIIFSSHDVNLGVQRIKNVLKKMSELANSKGDQEQLDSLVQVLQNQIRESDWLEKITAERWVKENHELAAQIYAREMLSQKVIN